MMSFRGAQYRLEKVFEDTRTTIFRDFAHAPSKVKATGEAILEVYDKKQVLACLELHTFSSLNAEFLPQYKKVFKGLKKKIVFVNRHTLESKKMKPLTREDIISAFEDKEIVFIEYIEDLIKALHALRFPKTVFLMMSSGNFGGLDLKSLAK
jgi:UDP-N-acetylmuramate: L-alanyl-gamma-D-glutamyl-meso-diaminopimelate ligase